MNEALKSLLAQHQSSLDGLSNEEAQKRLITFGKNELIAGKKKSYFLQFLEEFKDFLVIILIVAVGLAFFSGEYIDGGIILFIVILNATIGFIQKFKAEKAIEALRKMIAPIAKVLRDGNVQEIAASQVVPGDILILHEGDQIIADAVLLESNELQAQEAALTGESTAVDKAHFALEITPENLIYMGTNIVHGTAKALVTKTGMQTEMGKIATMTTETEKDKTPLQKEMQDIGMFIGKFTFVITAILIVLGIFVQKRGIIETILFATAVAVAAVPEGLPATITITLALGVQKLAKNNAIVKQLASVETLGSTTVICSDKTGTLTKNEMTVKELYYDRYSATVEGVGYDPKGEIKHNGKKPLDLLYLTAALCNNADVSQDNGQWKMIGDPTEGALITLVKKSDFPLDQSKENFQKLHEFPFDSDRKCMTVLYEEKTSGKIFAFTKGAPINIFKISDHMMMNDHPMKIDHVTQKEFLDKNEKMAQKALRVLAFAYRELSSHEIKTWQKYKETQVEGQVQAPQKFPFTKDEIEKNLTFLGLIGMIDPPRPEVAEAIDLTRQAGIKVYIITGDHGTTAEAIARQIGLIGKNKHLIINGAELNDLSDPEVKKLLEDKKLDIIFARVTPAHKLRIVSLLKELGEVVAVTGDGVNDAPALKRSDIGVAMGSGTDVSKEAANMILTDNSFSTIIKAVKEGRTIYENLKKFIYFMFSSNMGELLTIFGAILLNFPAPLTAVLILFVNLFSDVLPALALGLEPTENTIMSKKPRRKTERMLHRNFLFRIFYGGFFMTLIILSGFVWTLYRYGWEWGQYLDLDHPTFLKASTITFALMVISQMGIALSAKSEDQSIFNSGIFKNKKLIGAILISIILTIVIIQAPFLQSFFHTTSLDLEEWLIVMCAPLLIIGLEEARKAYVRNIKATV
ncbi:MAG: cation-transporting P-type ATPase [Candidatus Gracilibacteria bacterium]|jgi:magnesium-transporting ATPase (P-type)